MINQDKPLSARGKVFREGEYPESFFRRRIINPIKRAGAKKTALFTVVFILFALYAVSLVLPFMWMFFNSFKSKVEFGMDKWSISFNEGFKNYGAALMYGISKAGKQYTLLQMFLHSVMVVGGGVVVTLISCSVGSYVVSKYEFKGKRLIYNIVIIAMIVPIVGTLPAQYKLLKNLGLINNLVGIYFLYSGGFGFNFLFLYSYFKGISWGYAEAAQIDGASDFRIFLTIMLPMAAPALTAIGVLTFIGLWGDYQTPSIFLPDMPTVAVGLKDLAVQIEYSGNLPLQFAAVVLSVIPVLTLFICFQKTIMNNLTMGGLKG